MALYIETEFTQILKCTEYPDKDYGIIC